MAVAAGDIDYHLSIVGDGPGMDDAQPDPNASLGDFISTTEVVDASLHNLFDPVTGDDNAGSVVDYRCIFVRNDNGTDTLYDAVVWVATQVAGGATAAIGLDPAGVTADDSASPQAATIANENAAPSGVSFSTPTTKGAGLAIGDLGPGEVQAIWIRRTAANTAAVDNDGAELRVEGDTGE